MSTIPLAKPYTPEKLNFPVIISTKFDGVPVRIDMTFVPNVGMTFTIKSRQDETVVSVHSLVAEFAREYVLEMDLIGLPRSISLVGEVIQRNNWHAPFKITSGIVRRQYDQSDLLEIKLFDCSFPVEERRFQSFRERVDMIMKLSQFKLHKFVSAADFHTIQTQEELEKWWKTHETAFPKAEGIIIRNWDDEWQPGKRSWGYQKGVRDPSIDLRIVGFEEGKGKNAGAIGRVIAMYKGVRIGIGPGKMSYEDRADLWREFRNFPASWWTRCGRSQIATIKYKKDDSYDALRQPTFQHWRHDKTDPDA